MGAISPDICQQVIDMVYIRPSSPVVTPTAIKPLAESPHAPEEDSTTNDDAVSQYGVRPEAVKPVVERRKQDQDRRKHRKDSLLETRAGRDRRKSSVSISISI